MARDDGCLIGQGEQAGVDGIDDLGVVASRQVGASDASGEESVTGENHLERREVQTDGALGVTGSMNHLGRVVWQAYAKSVCERFVGWGGGRSFNPQPGGLLGHDLEEREIVLIEIDGSAGKGFELEGSADMVNVSVRNEDLLEGEP